MKQNHLQRLSVLLIHGKEKQRHHDCHHAKRRKADISHSFQQKKRRYSDECRQGKADQLPLGQIEHDLALYFCEVPRDRNITCHLRFLPPLCVLQSFAGHAFLSMRMKNASRKRPGLKQRKAKQHRISEHVPERRHDVTGKCNRLDQDSVDGDTNHDEKSLESQGKQGPEIILSDHALFVAPEGCKRNRRHADHEIDFNHPPVHDDKDDDGQEIEQELYNQALQEYTEQDADILCFQRALHRSKGRSINRCSALYQTAGLTDDIACYVEDCQRDLKGIRDQHHRNKGLEHPLEEDPGLKICQVIVSSDKLDQLVTGNERQDQPRNWHDDIFGNVPDHREDSGLETRRRLCELFCHFTDLAVQIRERIIQIVHDAGYQNFLQPRKEFFLECIQAILSFPEDCRTSPPSSISPVLRVRTYSSGSYRYRSFFMEAAFQMKPHDTGAFSLSLWIRSISRRDRQEAEPESCR